MKLTQDEVLTILKLFGESAFHSLQLETEDLKLSVSKGGHPQSGPALPNTCPEEAKAPETPNLIPETQQAGIGSPAVKAEAATVARDGLLPVRAPMLGILYRSPEPGASPYVEVGTFVKEEDTVALIEVMKVFNAVKAGVRGQIVEVCAENGHLVEYGQILFLVRPVDEAEGKNS